MACRRTKGNRLVLCLDLGTRSGSSIFALRSLLDPRRAPLPTGVVHASTEARPEDERDLGIILAPGGDPTPVAPGILECLLYTHVCSMGSERS